jgi:hypothetical protein
MPFLITGLLLARNVSLTGSWNADLKTTYDSMTRGGASVGWGPFSFGGSYVSSQHNDYHSAQISGSTITFADPQIIGFFVELLPLSPNPAPTLQFASTTCPLPRAGTLLTAASLANPIFSFEPNGSFVQKSKMLLDSAKMQNH